MSPTSSVPIDKKQLVDHIRIALEEELAMVERDAKIAREAAIHPDNKPEDEADTRSVEAAYLAGAQSKRAEDIRKQLQIFRFLPLREYTADDVVCPGGLVELEHKGTRAFYFIIPQGGGLVTRLDGKAIQVVTPRSPIGEALMGRKVGETVEVELRGALRKYKVISFR